MSYNSQIVPKIRRSIILAIISFSALGFGFGLEVANGQARQLSLADILIALRSKKAVIEEKNRILTDAVKDRGITFSLTPEIEKELSSTGAYRDLLDAIRTKALPAPVETVAQQKPEPPKTEKREPKVVQPAPDFSFYRNRANKELADGSLDLAIADLGKAIELNPGEVGTYLARGLAVLKQDKPDAAVKDLDKVVELDPKNSTAYFIRAQVFEKLGRTDNAHADFEKAATLDPANAEAVASAARLRQPAAQPSKSADPAPVKAEPVTEPKLVAVGALNGYATKLEIPKYSQIDKKMGFQGRVTVQVVLDEDGKVVSAVASDGPQSLRRTSEEAVRKSTFRPYREGEKGYRVTGFISFNFVPNQ